MAMMRAVKAHPIPQRPPIRVAAGQRVQIGARDTTWPAFVLVTTSDGEGWVPARHVDTGSSTPVMRAPYDTTELPTSAGEMLTVLFRDDLSGWTWVRNTAGPEGWVPDNTIEPTE